MQEHNFIPELNMKCKEFWKQTKQLAKEQNADEILAYMLLMLQRANTEWVKITKGARNKASQLVKNGRASLGVVADYSKDSAIEKAVMAMIDRVVAQKNINDAGIKAE